MARDEPGSEAGSGQDHADAPPGQLRTFPDPPAEPAGLTPRQRKVLEVIRDWVSGRSAMPWA
jgi:repressor LexA